VTMRVPSFDRFRRMSTALGIFVLGMVAGAAVYNGLFAAKFDALVERLHETEEKLGEYELEIRKLTNYRNQHGIIKSVVLHIETGRGPDGSPKPLDTVTETRLKQQLRRDLSAFLGRNVYDIDSEARLARLLLDGKVYKGLKNTDYVVEIRTVLVADGTMTVWVTARPRLPG
jgi:hypothetical protein